MISGFSHFLQMPDVFLNPGILRLVMIASLQWFSAQVCSSPNCLHANNYPTSRLKDVASAVRDLQLKKQDY